MTIFLTFPDQQAAFSKNIWLQQRTSSCSERNAQGIVIQFCIMLIDIDKGISPSSKLG